MTNQQEQTIKSILENVDNPIYWLTVMVKLGDITKAQAGYIISTYKIQ